MSKGLFTIREKIWAYKHGFCAEGVKYLKINSNNLDEFLSDTDFLKTEPNDPITKRLIDGKLVIPFTIGGRFPEYLPQHYCYINEYSQVIPLEDNTVSEFSDIKDYIIKLTQTHSELAIKRFTGLHGINFYHLVRKDDIFYINDEAIDNLDSFVAKINDKFVVTEWVEQHEVLSQVWDKSVATIRINVVNECGKAHIFFPFIRFGTSKTGAVSNASAGGIIVPIDLSTGNLLSGVYYYGYSQNGEYDVSTHPDSGVEFNTITIPFFRETIKMVNDICSFIPVHTFWGFDILLSKNGPKICEINSQPAIVCLQSVFGGLYKNCDKYICNYFADRLHASKKK